MVDCIVAYAASVLVDKMTDPRNQEGREMLEAVKADARASKQFLLLAHLWDPDPSTLDYHRCLQAGVSGPKSF